MTDSLVAARWFAVSILCAMSPVAAQCTNVWLPGGTVPGTDSLVRASTMWDPDGAGPASPKLVLGGNFTTVLQSVASRVAVFDPQTGTASALGAGITGSYFGVREVRAVAAMPNGELIVGGTFTAAGGTPVNSIARWNGTSWLPLGSGVTSSNGTDTGTVNALAVLPNGDLVVGGAFWHAGGVVAQGIARWNGATWTSFGQVNAIVNCLAVQPNGDLVAGGNFASVGGVVASYVARWDGTSWSALGTGLWGTPSPPFGNPGAYALSVASNGDVHVGGFFQQAGSMPANNIARWDGSTWSTLGGGTNDTVYSLVTLTNGDLVAGGTFSSPSSRVARWRAGAWAPLGSGLNSEVWALTQLPNGDVVAGGAFGNSGPPAFNFLGRFDGVAWQPLVPSALHSSVEALTALPNGGLVAGGSFTAVGSIAADHVAQLVGATWSALGTGTNGPVRALGTTPNGDVVAGGSFSIAGGIPASSIARWDGSGWTPLGAGTSGNVRALACLPNGDVIAGGYFLAAGGTTAKSIARWNGTTWSALGSGMTAFGSLATVHALAILPNGTLVAGGDFREAGGVISNHIAGWNGTTWSALGAGTNFAVRSLMVLPNGDLIAGGEFQLAGGGAAPHVARWNGTSWSAETTMMNGPVNALAQTPDGGYLATGEFTSVNGVSASRIARKNGAVWQNLGSGFDATTHAMVVLANGDVAIGGTFQQAGGYASPFLAFLSTTCPATASSQGVGCASSGGSNTLTALSLPWIDSTFRARGTGLPATALVVTVTSLTPVPQGIAPLSLAFAQAGIGCDILAAPDILGLLVTTTGVAESATSLPNTPPIVGVTFYHQFVPLEIDALGALAAVTATNSLRLTAGAY